MPLAVPAGRQPTGRPSREISQGDRELGSTASFLGFTGRAASFGATQSAVDRLTRVKEGRTWELSEKVIASCIEVHRTLGPGLLESIYEAALCTELELRAIPFQRQLSLPVVYKGKQLEQVYRADLIVGGQLLVEVKSVESVLFVHVAQAITYLRLTGLGSGLIVNFNSPLLRSGLRRVSLNPKNSHDSRSPDLPVNSESPGFGRSS